MQDRVNYSHHNTSDHTIMHNGGSPHHNTTKEAIKMIEYVYITKLEVTFFNTHMKKIVLILFLIANIFPIYAQEQVEETYYKDLYKFRKVSAKRANYILLKHVLSGGAEYHELKSTQNNKIHYKRYFNNGTPSGVWIDEYGNEIDYNFDVKYSENEFNDIIKYDIRTDQLVDSLEGIVPPYFDHNDGSFMNYFIQRLNYPPYAAENKLSGKVIVQFKISKQGKITNIEVLKSSAPMLDKEAVRLIKESPLWIPASMNNIPIETYVVFPVNFVLQ